MATRLGMDAKLYRNSGAYAIPTWDEVIDVKDVTLNLETGDADVTTRGNSGWRASVATLKDASVDFEMIWDEADLDFAAIKDAFLANDSIEFAVMDGDITVTGTQGLRALMTVTKFTRNEPLEDVISVNVTIKPTYSANPPEWMVIA